MKIQFDHDAESFGDSIGVPKKRMKEMKQTLQQLGFKPSSGLYGSKSKLIEEVIEKMNIIDANELFLLGSIFGVMDFLIQNDYDDGRTQDRIDTMAKRFAKGESPVLKIDTFKEEMKNGKEDF
jgi:hypothetical protein